MTNLTYGRTSARTRLSPARAPEGTRLPLGISAFRAHARLRPHTIRTKMVLAFLMIALVPAALMVFVDQIAIRAALTDDSERTMEAAAQQTATQLDSFIKTNLDAVRTQSQLPDYARYL